MTKEILFEAIGEIEDVYIKEAKETKGARKAEEEKDVRKVREAKRAREVGEVKDARKAEEGKAQKKKGRWAVWATAAAACLCLAFCGVYVLQDRLLENRWPVVTIHVPAPEVDTMETALIPRWEEMEIYQQYCITEWEGREYSSNGIEIPVERIGGFLGDSVAKGWDMYAESKGESGERFVGAEIYAVTEISEECAVAVQYEGEDGYYVFANSSYRPKTLKEFIEALNLQDEIIFGTADYEYRKASGEYATVLFEDVDSDKIWEMLLAAEDAENVYDESALSEIPEKVIDIGVDIPILGYRNISLAVHENGYIVTNILDTGKMFCIGTENTEAFIRYVLEECDGYEVLYVYDGESEEEAALDWEALTVIEHFMDGREDVISTYEAEPSEEDAMTSPSMPGQR